MNRFQPIRQAGLFIFLSMFFLTACQQSTPSAQDAGNYLLAPTFHLNTTDGQTISLPKLGESEKKVQLFLFWATWCTYCHELMPHLQSIKDEYGTQVDVYAINISDNNDPESYITSNGYEFTLLLEGDDVAKQYGAEGTPGLVVVDNRGQMRFQLSRELAPTYKALEGLPNNQRSRRIAPWWSAQIRKEIRNILHS